MPDPKGKSALFYVGKCWFIFGFPGLVGQSKRQIIFKCSVQNGHNPMFWNAFFAFYKSDIPFRVH